MSKKSPEHKKICDKLCLVINTKDNGEPTNATIVPKCKIREEVLEAMDANGGIHFKEHGNTLKDQGNHGGPSMVNSKEYRNNYDEIEWGTPPSRENMN